MTAAKLIWKLGPASASGRNSSTTSAPAAISRMLSASRPERNPGEDQHRRDAASHRRHLRPGQQGVADPGRRRRGRRDQHQVEAQRQRPAQREQLAASAASPHATTAAMCSPLTDSKWVRPLRRIASASSSPTAFWSPVASAMAIPARLGRHCALDMAAQRVARPVEAARLGGSSDDRPGRAPCRPRRSP